MKSVSLFSLLLLMVLFPDHSSGIGYVVGNGGEGWFIEENLYLYDLVEGGIEKNPYIGAETKEVFKSYAAQLKVRLNDLPFSESLLVRKLSDLERVLPGLGYYIAESLTSHLWMGVATPLESTVDQERVLKGSNNVQIANRLDHTIRIYRPFWNLLNQEHQIALLIHEGVYSLLKPACDVSGFCAQSSRQARTITALLFTEAHFKTDPTQISSHIVPLLSIPQHSLEIRNEPQKWQLLWTTSAQETQTRYLDTAIPAGHSFFAEIKVNCEDLFYMSLGLPDHSFSVSSRIELPAFIAKFKKYKTWVKTSGDPSSLVLIKEGEQWAFEIAAQKKTDDVRFFKFSFGDDPRTCYQSLIDHYRKPLYSTWGHKFHKNSNFL